MVKKLGDIIIILIIFLNLSIVIVIFKNATCDNSNSYAEKFTPIDFAPISNCFSYPVGIKQNGKNYYIAQHFNVRNKNFGGNFHLGEDWNGKNGGNSDFGDPVYSIGKGRVLDASYAGSGWGNVIRIIHKISITGKKSKYFESVYGHLKSMKVQKNQIVTRGQKIGEIGNADGLYLAHLHFEIRNRINMELGGGYAPSIEGFIKPSKVLSIYACSSIK